MTRLTDLEELMPGRPASHAHRPLLHALTHGLAAVGEAYGALVASMVTSSRPPAWQHAVEEYDRRHPEHGGPRAGGA